MIFLTTPLDGLYLVDIETHKDERGFFARTWDADIAGQHGLQQQFDYTCISQNTAVHTLRGMHYQRDPHGEVKLVRCTKGAIFDVAVDLRPDSATYRQWHGVELRDDNYHALYIPPGFAHGFLTLSPNAEVLYCIANPFVPEAARGIRYDDPAFGIVWPAVPAVLSDRDRTYPDFVS